jgi:aminopeptidase N
MSAVEPATDHLNWTQQFGVRFMTEVKNRVFLKDYQPPVHLIPEIELEFQIEEDFTLVTNTMTMTGPLDQPIFLNGEHLILRGLSLNHQEVSPKDYILTPESLTINNSAAYFKNDIRANKFCLKVVTEIYPNKNTALEGLYRSGSGLCTQNEAQGFRKITYFMDRPDVMSCYTCKIVADSKKFPILLSNGNRTKKELLANGKLMVVWNDPLPKPCYLFALVAGDYGYIKDEFITKSGRTVVLEIYCQKGFESRCHFAMTSLKKSMQWDEERFGREYDLDLYMILAVDDFNAGAMENKGLNIFNSRLVFADPNTTTDFEYESIEAVIAHEYFHNWTGNRITLRDWFHLSLKEGLTVFRDQEFTADQTSHSVKRIDDVQMLRSRQFAEDASANAHPVRPESCLAIDNFYTATIYEKGAEVIRMIQTIIGLDGFRKGMDLYFNRHDGQAVIIEDFVKCMEDTNKVDLTHFKLWYEQAGTPELTVKENYNAENQLYSLEFSQVTHPTLHQKEKRNLYIPIKLSFFSKHGEKIDLSKFKLGNLSADKTEGVFILSEKSATLDITESKEKLYPSILRDFSAPVKLKGCDEYDQLMFLANHDDNGFNKWDAIQKIYLKELHQIYSDECCGRNSKVNNQLITLIDGILDQCEKIGFGLVFKLFSMPSTAFFIQDLEVFNPEAVFQAYFKINLEIAIKLREKILKVDNLLADSRFDDLSFEAMSKRVLRGNLWSKLGHAAENNTFLYEKVKSARNMSEQWGALSALNYHLSDERTAACNGFKSKWQNDSLVMNKFLALEASLDHPSTLETVQNLMKEEFFKITNPNNVRSLLHSFSNFNIRGFHRKDGLAYTWMAEQIINVDKINPQTAARLSGCFDKWTKLDEKRKKLAHDAIESVVKFPNLSKNTYELMKNILDS